MTYPITPGLDLAAFARKHRVRFVRKDASRLMRFLGWLLGLFGYKRFLSHAWTTIGRTVYYPTTGPRETWDVWYGPRRHPGEVVDAWNDYLSAHRSTVEHEFHHVIQFERLWHLHSLLYLLFPLPVGLAWYRWWAERGAYLHMLRHYGRVPREQAFVCTDSTDGAAVWTAIPMGVAEDKRVVIGAALPPDADESMGVGTVWISQYVEVLSVDDVVNTLHRVYAWPWPKAWMRRWLERRLGNG